MGEKRERKKQNSRLCWILYGWLPCSQLCLRMSYDHSEKLRQYPPPTWWPSLCFFFIRLLMFAYILSWIKYRETCCTYGENITTEKTSGTKFIADIYLESSKQQSIYNMWLDDDKYLWQFDTLLSKLLFWLWLILIITWIWRNKIYKFPYTLCDFSHFFKEHSRGLVRDIIQSCLFSHIAHIRSWPAAFSWGCCLYRC